MAERERSLDLDLETVGYGEKAQRVARIAVVGTEGCTRDGSASTITLDCRSASALAREVDRLREELEDALARAQSELEDASGGGAQPRAAPARAADRPAAAHRPHLSVQATVADAMTREVRTVAANDRLSSAKAAMDEGGFRHLVVLGRDGEVEGVLSHRDLFFGPLAWSMGQGKQGYQTLLEASRVKEVMQTEVETISPSAPLQQAAERMRERRIGCLPVVEADRLVGLITEGDLVSLIAEASAESEPAR